MLDSLHRGYSVRQTDVNCGRPSAANEFTQRAEQAASPTACRVSDPDLQFRVRVRENLARQKLAERLRSAACAERLVEESGSQGLSARCAAYPTIYTV